MLALAPVRVRRLYVGLLLAAALAAVTVAGGETLLGQHAWTCMLHLLMPLMTTTSLAPLPCAAPEVVCWGELML